MKENHPPESSGFLSRKNLKSFDRICYNVGDTFAVEAVEGDGGDNNDVVEFEKLQGEKGGWVRIRAGDINVG